MTWLALYILVSDLPKYEALGWKYWGPGPCLGGWPSIIVRKKG